MLNPFFSYLWGFARGFIAGETVQDAIEAVADLPGKGLRLTLDYLGESVASYEEAQAAADEYVRIIHAIVRSGIERNVSLNSLTQLGLDVDLATAVYNMRKILEHADAHGFFVRIDMENSPYTDRTLQILETLWQQGHRTVGTVIQSCLTRSPQDVRRLNELGARVRLVKGAYKEPKAVASQEKAQVDAAFFELMHACSSQRRTASADTAPEPVAPLCSQMRRTPGQSRPGPGQPPSAEVSQSGARPRRRVLL